MSRLIKIADWSGEKRGNVVFVHGLGGHPYDTWQRKSEDGSFWPHWLAQDVPGVAVFSFGYISPPTNWLGTAMPLLDEAAHALRVLLNSDDLRTGPITFVCHSLGGLIIKSVLRAANEQKGDPSTSNFLRRCRQVVFVATPHTGAGMAGLLEWFAWLAWPSGSVRNLVANTPELRDLNFGYRTLAEEREETLRHLVFYEMVDTLFGRVVSPASADPGLPNCRPTPIREDHIAIAKPRRRDDLVYSETRGLVHNLSPGPRVSGEPRTYPLEPFTMEWSWRPLVPKLLRLTAVALVAIALWYGVPRGLRALSDLKEDVSGARANTERILKIISQKEGVPLETIRAILASMGEAAQTLDALQIEQKLKDKASEFKRLSERLTRLSADDPEVARLRRNAAEALEKGRFAEADAFLATAEKHDLATLGDLEATAKEKRLSAAQSRAERATAALLRVNPDAYREAAAHYAEAARIAKPAQSKMAHEYAIQQGKTLIRLGEEFGQNPALQEAIEHFRRMLASVDREHDSHNWAHAQNKLGHALAVLGTREGGTEKLQQAVTAFGAALTEWSPKSAWLEWAGTKNNLANALMALGRRVDGTEALKAAVDAYQESLTEWTRQRVPLLWATTQNNLGGALIELGTREISTVTLKGAVSAFREAKREWTREAEPLLWATAQNNLGGALVALGQREDGTLTLKSAVVALHEALQVWSPERVPLLRATAQSNLCEALRVLGEREREMETLGRGVAACNAALEVQTRDRVPLDWAATQNHLGNALRVLGERQSGTETLDKAVAAFDQALMERTRDRAPLDWAVSLGNQGVASVRIAQRRKNLSTAEAALQQIETALKTLQKAGHAYFAAVYEGEIAKAREVVHQLRAR